MRFRRDTPPPRRQRLRPVQNREPAQPPAYQPRRRGATEAVKTAANRNFWLQRAGLVVLLIAGIVSVLNVLSLSGHAKVLPLNSGQALTLHSQEEYQAAADKLLATSVWNRNKITVNTDAISREMQRQFPELTDVSVTIPLLAHRPVVYVEPARASLILETPTSGSYVLDNSGKTLVRGANVADLNQPDLPVLTDNSNISVKVNSQAVPASLVDFILTVTGQLAAKEYPVSAMTLSANGTQLDVHLAGQPYFVKFNLQGSDARQQAGTFLATIQYLKDHNAVPSQYVDVRVDGRAYYQ